MAQARSCGTFEDFLDVARTRNDEFIPPLLDGEVVRVARSAWGYTERGENRFGRPGAFFPADETNRLITSDQDVFLLLAFLRANNGPDRKPRRRATAWRWKTRPRFPSPRAPINRKCSCSIWPKT
jgi:hypothetical protein